MGTRIVKISLKGIKKWIWRTNLNGFFIVNGKELSDAQVRKMVEWAIERGYKYNVDIPKEEVIELLNL
jgi:hypothetical protein